MNIFIRHETARLRDCESKKPEVPCLEVPKSKDIEV